MRWRLIGIVGLLVAGTAEVASGTVYAWRESDGVHHFTNFLEDVPEEHRATVQSFVRRTAPPAEEPAPGTGPAPPPEAVREETDSYRLGVERGATIALEQTRAVGELARSLVDSLRRGDRPTRAVEHPAPPVRRAPEFRVSIIPAGARWPARVFYGAIAPAAGCSGCCCGAGFGYGFATGRLIPHSHFFPTLAGARRAPLFFPNGHLLDADLFLVGDGYWID